jgi:hypothetical protein
MSTDKGKHPVVVNPGEMSISLPATRRPPQEMKPQGCEIFVTSSESQQPTVSIARKTRILSGQGKELWQVRLKDDAATTAPLQIAKRLSREFVRSKLQE